MAKKKKIFFKKKLNENTQDQSLTKSDNIEDLNKETENKPSKNGIKALVGIKYAYITIFFVLLAGFFNPIIRGAQYTNQVIIAVLVLFLGLGGIVLIYKSKSRTSEKTQWIFLAGGFGLILFSVLLMYDVMGKSLLTFN